MSAKSANIRLSGRHVADISATLPAKFIASGPSRASCHADASASCHAAPSCCAPLVHLVRLVVASPLLTPTRQVRAVALAMTSVRVMAAATEEAMAMVR